MIEYFPNSIVLPTFGNNDNKYHYLPAFGSYAPAYYTGFFNKFFEKHPTNSKLKDLELIRQTLDNSGYFKVQIAQNLYVISLNTLYFNSRDTYDDVGKEVEQLLWLEE